MEKNQLEILDHTGDIGLIIRGNDISTIFILAAKGMFGIICPHDEIHTSSMHTFDIEAYDIEELLVNWLAELNYYFSVEYMLFSEFHIHQISDKHLIASARGERIKPNKHHIHMEIKAVTYHKLYIKKMNNTWEAQVIFDI